MSEARVHDVIVIGAGLAGLTAALRLQQAGQRVLLLERRGVPGGLCGTHVLEGYEFVIGCNDFGTGLERELRALGVPVRFKRVKTRFCLEREVYQVPLDGRTLLNLARHAGDVVRVARALRSASEVERLGYLGPLVQACVRHRDFADFISSFSYALGMAPADMRLDELKASFSKEYAYGYEQPLIPEGGPGVLVQRMVERFEALGGRLALGTECTGVASRGALKAVSTPGGELLARHVISSQPRRGSHPGDAKPGLAVSTFHLAVRKSLPFPEGVHTLTWFPSDVAGWLSRLDAGELPEAFGFHLFASDLPPKPDSYSINAYCFLPRGMDEPSEAQLARVERYVLERAERLLPGLGASLLYKRFVSPRQYTQLHGLSSRAVQAVTRAGFQKPEGYDAESGVYHVGNGVQPPGEHAGGAVLSGRRAAEAVLRPV